MLSLTEKIPILKKIAILILVFDFVKTRFTFMEKREKFTIGIANKRF